jgi:hypothetical protein
MKLELATGNRQPADLEPGTRNLELETGNWQPATCNLSSIVLSLEDFIFANYE